MSTEAEKTQESEENCWLLPVTAEGWDGDLDCFIMYGVEFKEDWGPWKAGDKLDSVSIDLPTKKVQVHDDDGELVTEVRFKLVPQP